VCGSVRRPKGHDTDGVFDSTTTATGDIFWSDASSLVAISDRHDNNLVPNGNIYSSSASDDQIETSGATSPIQPNNTSARICVVTICLMIGLLLALLTDQVANVVGLMGGIFCTTIMWAFPGLVFFKGIGTSYSPRVRYLISGTLGFMSLMGYISSVVILLQMAGYCSSSS